MKRGDILVKRNKDRNHHTETQPLDSTLCGQGRLHLNKLFHMVIAHHLEAALIRKALMIQDCLSWRGFEEIAVFFKAKAKRCKQNTEKQRVYDSCGLRTIGKMHISMVWYCDIRNTYSKTLILWTNLGKGPYVKVKSPLYNRVGFPYAYVKELTT